MRLRDADGRCRAGKILILFALLLTVLLGLVGLVIDGGLLLAAHRQAQNAADSAALAAAMELFRGASEAEAVDSATRFVTEHNGFEGATLTIHFGTSLSGQSAPQHRKPGYVEVFVDLPVSTFFIQMLGGNPDHTARARAVAGFETVIGGEGVIVLDPRGLTPGLSVTGGALLRVQGAVIVNSRGKGIDQYGETVDSDYNQYAVATGNNARIYATYMQVAGGVDGLQNIYHIDEYPNTPALTERTAPFPLFARAPQVSDPLRDLPVPQVAGQAQPQGPITVNNGETRIFTPGIYSDIQVNSGGTANFQPGIYVLMPTGPNQGLRINGASTVRGEGVLFYATGSDYLAGPSPGFYDTADGPVDFNFAADALPPPPAGEDLSQVHFATVDINANDADITLTGIPDAGSPYKDVVIFQRRRNQNPVQIQSNAGANVRLAGTIYAKWANFKLSGGGRYDALFVVGTMAASGQATVIVDSGGKTFHRAQQVFLVE
jgi:hypothetical protein